MTSHTSTPTDPRRRIRDLGLSPGVLPTGPLNAITDVAGVRVGHATLVEGDAIRTGVTVILPRCSDRGVRSRRATSKIICPTP